MIDTGTWLSGRKVLIHPSGIADVGFERQEILTPLARQQVVSREQVKSSPPWDPLQLIDELYE